MSKATTIVSENDSSAAPCCPYAQVEKHSDEVRQALSLAKTSCPAFQSKNETDSGSKSVSCPFRRVVSTEEFQNLLQTVPSSHYTPTDQNDLSVPFRLALEHVHAVSQAIHSNISSSNDNNSNRPPLTLLDPEAYTLRGGCPFKRFLYLTPENNVEQSILVPFVHAMESFSLTAIMSQMLLEQQHLQDDATVPGLTLRRPSALLLAEQVRQSGELTTVQHDQKDTVTETSNKLSTALKLGTSASHRAAENVHFVRNFIKGVIPRTLFVQLLENLCHVYSVLEEELDRYSSKSKWQSLHRPYQLARKQALLQDLYWFTGTNLPQDPTPATVDYITRLRLIARSDPLLLLSHAYTRYLGDLSGGRVLARVARRALELPADGSGLKFYEFENIPEGAKAFKNWYRAELDGLSLTEEEVHKIVGEANVAFALNMRMFEELDVMAGIQGAAVRPLSEALKYGDDAYNETKDNLRSHYEPKQVTCPFANLNSQQVQDRPVSSEQTVIAVPRGKCPWPFILLHDPLEGMKDYKTCIVLCFITCYVYSLWCGGGVK
jgi:heme oxygenase